MFEHGVRTGFADRTASCIDHFLLREKNISAQIHDVYFLSRGMSSDVPLTMMIYLFCEDHGALAHSPMLHWLKPKQFLPNDAL